MNINELIQALESTDNLNANIMAIVKQTNQMQLYGGFFGNSEGKPSITVYNEAPLPSVKKCDMLIEQLKAWRDNNSHYRKDAHVYLSTIHEYEDDSYDFRYFELNLIKSEADIFLISTKNESLEFRDHYEAFDDDMLDDG